MITGRPLPSPLRWRSTRRPRRRRCWAGRLSGPRAGGALLKLTGLASPLAGEAGVEAVFRGLGGLREAPAWRGEPLLLQPAGDRPGLGARLCGQGWHNPQEPHGGGRSRSRGGRGNPASAAAGPDLGRLLLCGGHKHARPRRPLPALSDPGQLVAHNGESAQKPRGRRGGSRAEAPGGPGRRRAASDAQGKTYFLALAMVRLLRTSSSPTDIPPAASASW